MHVCMLQVILQARSSGTCWALQVILQARSSGSCWALLFLASIIVIALELTTNPTGHSEWRECQSRSKRRDFRARSSNCLEGRIVVHPIGMACKIDSLCPSALARPCGCQCGRLVAAFGPAVRLQRCEQGAGVIEFSMRNYTYFPFSLRGCCVACNFFVCRLPPSTQFVSAVPDRQRRRR